MSVTCDKIVGYTYDITKDIDKICGKDLDSFDDKWLTGAETLLENGITFKPYWSAKSDEKGKLMIVPDCVSNCGYRLVYIIEYEWNAFYEDDVDIIKSINGLFKTRASVPFEVKQIIRDGYKQIFNEELERTSEIKPEYLVLYR